MAATSQRAAGDRAAAPALQLGRYLVAYDAEGYASVAYQPRPGRDWVAIEQVTGRTIELDTANVDQAGEPELLLTVEYQRLGNPDQGSVRTLHVLRTGATVDSLLTVRVGCSDYHHAWEGDFSGELSDFSQTQPVSAGYGFIRFGRVEATCEHRPPTLPCACDSQELAEAGGAAFARAGLYRWQRGRLAWVSPR